MPRDPQCREKSPSDIHACTLPKGHLGLHSNVTGRVVWASPRPAPPFTPQDRAAVLFAVAAGQPYPNTAHILQRYEATVAAVEAERDALREKAQAVCNAFLGRIGQPPELFVLRAALRGVPTEARK